MTRLWIVAGALLASGVASSAHAAEMSMVGAASARVGHEVAIEIFLDTAQELVNALEGGLVIPASLEVRDIRFDGSIVSLWITRPRVDAAGVIAFAGLVPGGYQGTPEKMGRGNVMTVIVRPKEVGTARITFTPETTVLLNDGEGTKAQLTSAPLALAVQAAGDQPQTPVVTEDVQPPLAFAPQIVEGKPYSIEGLVLIFDAQDKESGIAGYEVAFSNTRTSAYDTLAWKEALSPLALTESQLSEYIYVRAVDMKGNFRVAVLAPYHFSLVAFLTSWAWYVLAAIVVALLIYRHRKRIKRA